MSQICGYRYTTDQDDGPLILVCDRSPHAPQVEHHMIPAYSIGLDRPSAHEDFAAEVDVYRLMDGDHGRPDVIVGYTASVRVKSADCGEPFRWMGVKAGLSQREPMCSVDETELRAPLRPSTSDPDFGMGLPGFAVGWREQP